MKLGQQCRLDRRVGQYEIEHRKHCVECVERMLPPSHSLVRVIKKCLHSDPKKRPTAREILTTMEEVRNTVEGTTAIAKMNAVRQVLAAKQFTDLEHQLKVIINFTNSREVTSCRQICDKCLFKTLH